MSAQLSSVSLTIPELTAEDAAELSVAFVQPVAEVIGKAESSVLSEPIAKVAFLILPSSVVVSVKEYVGSDTDSSSLQAAKPSKQEESRHKIVKTRINFVLSVFVLPLFVINFTFL